VKNKKLKLVAVFLVGLGLTGLDAQEALLSAGGNALGHSGGSASYSVGQVAYTAIVGANGSLSGGVQHAYEISVMPGSTNPSHVNIACSVYPNPFTDNLTLKVTNCDSEGLSYLLANSIGQQVEEGGITANQTDIAMGRLSPAIYILTIMLRGQEIKTIKVVKRKTQ
jgi:hypothetical protein